MTAIAASAVIQQLAAPSGEAAKAGPWGFAIILLLCVACYFLFKSMSRHLRKVRDEFPADRPGYRLPEGRRIVTTPQRDRGGVDLNKREDEPPA